MKKSFLIFFVCLLPLIAFPIGRSGNGKMTSVEEGFTTEIPAQYPQQDELDNGSMRLTNPNIVTGGPGSAAEPLRLFAHRFAKFYPTRSSMDRDSLKLDLTMNDWLANSLASNPCVDLYWSDRGSVSAMIAIWGVGKGVVFAGPRNQQTTNAITEMIQNLQLEPGACAWK